MIGHPLFIVKIYQNKFYSFVIFYTIKLYFISKKFKISKLNADVFI